jgi:hypothetical protein
MEGLLNGHRLAAAIGDEKFQEGDYDGRRVFGTG